MTPLQLMLKCRRVRQLLSPGLYLSNDCRTTLVVDGCNSSVNCDRLSAPVADLGGAHRAHVRPPWSGPRCAPGFPINSVCARCAPPLTSALDPPLRTGGECCLGDYWTQLPLGARLGLPSLITKQRLGVNKGICHLVSSANFSNSNWPFYLLYTLSMLSSVTGNGHVKYIASPFF